MVFECLFSLSKRHWTPNKRYSQSHASKQLEHIRNKDIEALQMELNPQGIVLNDYLEARDYLKTQDLHAFLGLGQKFNCILHDDNDPSASIFRNNATGHYLYKCFGQCDVVIDVIDIVGRLLNCSHKDAMNFLKEVYSVHVDEEKWNDERLELFEDNINKVCQDNFTAHFPNTDKASWRIRESVMKLNITSCCNLHGKGFTDALGNPVFFKSLKELGIILGIKDDKSIRKRVNSLVLLGFLNKLNDDNIPDFLLKEAKSIQTKYNLPKRVNYYSIPHYDEIMIQTIEERAKTWLESGLTITGMTRELIYKFFGEEEADRVYPQLKGKPFEWNVDHHTPSIIGKLKSLLEKQGYFKKSDVVSTVKLEISKSDSFRNYDKIAQGTTARVLPSILKQLGLKKLQLNKLLKEQYGVISSGYPVIYTSQSY